jgi:hypothetical protein
MDLTKILAISGKPGLFRMVGDAKDKLIVESLLDGKRSPAFTSEKISTLQEISIYTETGDMPLEDLLKSIYEKQDGQPVPNPKKASSSELKALFEEVLPDYDRDAVYVSDMKKVFSWYNLLLEKQLLEFSGEEEEEAKGDAQTTPETEEPESEAESDTEETNTSN